MDSIQILVALILYLSLFGWIGYRRGTISELIVLLVVGGGYLALRRYDSIVITLFNLFGKFIAFARAGGLSGDNNDALALLLEADDIIAVDQTDTVVFLVWIAILLLTYLITSRAGKGGRNRSDANAALIGILNGIFYFAIFMPLLASILFPNTVSTLEDQDGISWVFENTAEVVSRNIGSFWSSVGDQQPIVAALLLTLLIVLAAATLRRSNAKS